MSCSGQLKIKQKKHENDDDDAVQGLALQLSAGSQLGLHTVAALATLVAGCQVPHPHISASSVLIISQSARFVTHQHHNDHDY